MSDDREGQGLFARASTRRSALAFACFLFGAVGSACYLTADFNGVADGKALGDAGTSDAQAESGLTADGAVAFNCLGSHLICSTFDNGALDSDGWTIRQTDGGTVNLTTNEYVSPPASFHSLILSNNSASVLQGAFLTQKVRPMVGWKTLDFSFDFRLAGCNGKGGGITVLAISPSTEAVFGLVFGNNGLMWGQVVTNVGDGGSLFIPSQLTQQPKLKEWIRIDVKLSNPAKATVDITFDGVPVLKAQSQAPFTPAGNNVVSLGPDGTGTNAQCEMAFDNVTFDSQ